MHEIGKKFVLCLLQKCKKNIADISSIQVKPQEEKIDVLLIIEGPDTQNNNIKIALIIEDKTNTSQHGDQLKKYKEYVSKKYEGYEVLAIYFKTGNQSNLSPVLKHNDIPFMRKDLLEFFKQCEAETTNIFYLDYVAWVNKIEEGSSAWINEIIGCWTNNIFAWEGFFECLVYKFTEEEKLLKVSWKAERRFKSIKCYFQKWEEDNGQRPYILLSNKNECRLEFKLAFKDSKGNGKKWHEKLNKVSKELSLNTELTKSSGKAGEYIVVCSINKEHWLGDSSQKVDIDKVIDNLKKYQNLIDKCLELDN